MQSLSSQGLPVYRKLNYYSPPSLGLGRARGSDLLRFGKDDVAQEQILIAHGQNPTALSPLPGEDIFGQCKTFVPIEPAQALKWSFEDTIRNWNILRLRNPVGEAQPLEDAWKGYFPSPLREANEQTSRWIHSSQIYGIQPRALGSFLDIVKLAMTTEADAIYIQPIFEAGAGGSLYAPASWNIMPGYANKPGAPAKSDLKGFMDPELTRRGYDTPEKQFKWVVSMLHGLGKKVGLDCVPHTDRFSEAVLANPQLFEWTRIVPVESPTSKVSPKEGEEAEFRELMPPEINYLTVHQEVEAIVLQFVKDHGDAQGKPIDEPILKKFFKLPEVERLNLLFGPPEDSNRRLSRRVALMEAVRAQGYETLPIANNPPYKPVRFKKMHKNEDGTPAWAEFEPAFKTDFPVDMFGNITPYAWYHRKPNGMDDLKQGLRADVLKYFTDHWAAIQKQYDLDFLRADMVHMQPNYASDDWDRHGPIAHEFWRDIKEGIQQKNQVPYLASFGETFLDNKLFDSWYDAQNKGMDVALGYTVIPDDTVTDQYPSVIREYSLKGDGRFKPVIGAFTADMDHPDCTQYLIPERANNWPVRVFLSKFLNRPGYMGMGLETRDFKRPTNSKPEDFTGTYNNDVGQGPYQWGGNIGLFIQITRMRQLYEQLKSTIQSAIQTGIGHWNLNNDDPYGELISWSFFDPKTKLPQYVMLANAQYQHTKPEVYVENPFAVITTGEPQSKPLNEEDYELAPLFTTNQTFPQIPPPTLERVSFYKGQWVKFTNVAPGECRIYKVVPKNLPNSH